MFGRRRLKEKIAELDNDCCRYMDCVRNMENADRDRLERLARMLGFKQEKDFSNPDWRLYPWGWVTIYPTVWRGPDGRALKALTWEHIFRHISGNKIGQEWI